MKRVRFLWILAIPILFLAIWIAQRSYLKYDLWTHQLVIQPVVAEVESPLEISSGLEELTPDTILEIHEYTLLPSQDKSGEVVAISESPNRDTLMAVYSNNFLYHWDIPNKKIVSQLNIHNANQSGVNFSLDGQWILTPGETALDNSLVGFEIINTQSGELSECYATTNCPMEQKNHYLNQLLSPNAQILIAYDSYDGTLSPVLEWGQKLNLSSQIREGDCIYNGSYDLDLHMMTISPSQKYVAYIFETGEICVRDFEEFSDIDQKTGIELPFVEGRQPPFSRIRFDLRKKGEGRVKVYGFEFDPTNRWLAVLTHRELVVFDLQKPFSISAQLINSAIPNGSAVLFNRTGTVLAVGTNNMLMFYSLENGEKVAEFETPEISSLYFTRDNRILVWGDNEGNLHLWGVPQK